MLKERREAKLSVALAEDNILLRCVVYRVENDGFGNGCPQLNLVCCLCRHSRCIQECNHQQHQKLSCTML